MAAKVASATKNDEQAAREGAALGRRLKLQAAIHGKVEAAARERGLARLATLQGEARSRAEARLEILAALDIYARAANVSSGKAVNDFCARYNAGEIEVEDWVREQIRDVHPSTVYRWRNKLESEGAAALAGKYGARRGTSKIDSQPELQRFVIAMLVEHPHASAAHVYKAARARFADSSIELPSKRSLERWMASWKNENGELFTAIANPDAWKNRHMLALGSASEGVTRLNQRWEFDSTPADLELTDGRHSIIGVIDIYSRRLMYLVSKTSKAESVASLIRRALLAWGVPEQVKTDNGSDYTSHHIRRVFLGLGVEQLLCQPFSGWEKPHIERSFRSFQHDLVELMPGYIGHNVAERKALEARQSFAERLFKKGQTVALRMSSDELQAFCDRWIDDIYHHQPHDALDGRTPFEMAASWSGGIRTIEDERALDVLLAPAPGDGLRTVTKKGIKVEGFHYIAPELGDLPTGSRVHVRFDPHDVGRIYVFDSERFVCVAEDPRYTGLSRQDVAAQAKQRQKARVQEARRVLRAAARKERTRDIADEILNASARQHAGLVAFPQRGTAHDSDGLAAAAAASEARDRLDAPVESTPIDEAAVARVTRMIRDEQRQDETAEDRFRRWIALDARRDALSELEQRWLQQYESTSEFHGRKLIYDDFGADAFSAG